jgi:hypothetical protein
MSPTRASLNASEIENSVAPAGNLEANNASTFVFQPVESRYTDWTTPVPSYDSRKI